MLDNLHRSHNSARLDHSDTLDGWSAAYLAMGCRPQPAVGVIHLSVQHHPTLWHREVETLWGRLRLGQTLLHGTQCFVKASVSFR